MSNDHFDAVLGRIPSGVFILTIGRGEQATGMLASWVQQAGFEPPTVSVAIKKGRYVAQWLSEKQPFVLNLLAEGQKSHLAHFAKGFEPRTPAFTGIDTTPSAQGVPILDGALGHLQCEPTQFVDSPDHRLFLARVVGGQLSQASTSPMIHIRNSGKHY